MNVHPDNDNRTRSGFFDITYPQDNLYDVPAGTYKAVVDGYYAFIEPLPHGEHLVRIDASVNNPTDPSYNFAYEVLYHMNVQ